MREITPRQLSLHNGQEKEDVWICVDGVVYEVTGSRMWLRGKHYDHWAGQELAQELLDAPHTADVLKKFPVVGKLVDK